MPVRALVVLLVVLNLGVAAWWASRAPSPQSALPEQPAGVPRLQLVSETVKAAPAAAAPVARAAAIAPAAEPAPAKVAAMPTAPVAEPATAPPTAPAQCYSFGPFTDAAAAQNAQSVLQAVSQRVAQREERSGGARGWRVYVPAAASLVDAQAMTQRIATAGFNDFFIVREGAEANSIALGRYRNEDSAKRRADALSTAGFPARAEPLGEGKVAYWLDVLPAPQFDITRAQAAVTVPSRRLDCARLQ